MFRGLRAARTISQVRSFGMTAPCLMPVYYSKSHEWVSIEEGKATVGITHFAQEELGEVVYIDLPEVGETVEPNETYGTVESVKATSSLISPVGGTIADVNEELTENSGLVNESPEDKAWTIKLEGITEPEGLMTREEYEKYQAEVAE